MGDHAMVERRPAGADRCRRTLRRGLTLLELAAVVVILGVIAWVVLPRISKNLLDSKGNTCYLHRRDIEVQVELWYRNKGSWPSADLGDIGMDPAYFPEGLSVCPVDGTAYALDGVTHQVVGHAHPPP